MATGTPLSRTTKLPVLLVALVLLTYSVLRAVHVSFSWDESWTYIHHVLPRMWMQQLHDKMGGNHHLLNVWGMILSRVLFGDGELALRLPSLLAHVLYLYATARIALLARSGIVVMAAFLLLNVHPYLLDFFALARGYGAANGWMMFSLWQVTRYFREGPSVTRAAMAIGSAVLATMSHVIMVNYLLAFVTAFVLIWTWRASLGRAPFPWAQCGVLVGGAAIGLALVLPNALSLSQGGSLNFGCATLWDCMIESLGMKLLYHQPYPWSVLQIMAGLLIVLTGCCLLIVIVAQRQGWTDGLFPMAFGALLLLICMVGLMVQHGWLDVPLPQSRTALFLVPLAMFILVSGLVAWPAGQRAPAWIGGLLCVPLLWHQWNSTNLTYAVEWKPSGELAKMVAIIRQDHAPIEAVRPAIVLSTSFESFGCLPYYQVRDHLQWLLLKPRDHPQPYKSGDYYIVEYDGQDKVDTAHWTLLYHSAATNTSLYRDERWRDRPVVVHHEVQDMEAPGIPGRTTAEHHSGAHAVRFDQGTRATQGVSWVVSDTLRQGSVQLFGTARVLQENADNWVSLVIRVMRGQEELAKADVSSALQMDRFGIWGQVSVSLRPDLQLLPGDVVMLDGWPLTDDSPMFMDDLELLVLR